MNIDELVAAARIDETPTDDVVERHRTQFVTHARSAAESTPAATAPSGQGTWLDTEPRPDWPHRRRLAMVASAALVAGTVAGVLALADRDDAVQPIDSAPAVPQTSVATTATTGEPVSTAATIAPQRVAAVDLPDLVGPLNIELHPVTVDVAEVGGETLRLRMTDTELCIESHVGEFVYNTTCDAPPTTFTFTGKERIDDPNAAEPTSFTVIMMGPADVTFALLLRDGSPACRLVGHPVPEIGPITVWTCDQPGLVEPWDLHATGEGLDVITEVPIFPPFRDGPLPSIGDPIPAVDDGDWVTNWSSSGIPPRSMGLTPVGRDGFIVGYSKGIYDEGTGLYDLEGHPIGQFIDGKPILDSETEWTTAGWTVDATLGISMRVPDTFTTDPSLEPLSQHDIDNGLFLLQRWYPAGASQVVALSVQRDPGDAAPVNVQPGYRSVETSAGTWKLVDFGEGDRTNVVGFARILGYLFEITGDDLTVEQIANAITVSPVASP